MRIRQSGLMALSTLAAAVALGLLEPVVRVSASLILLAILLGLVIAAAPGRSAPPPITRIRLFGGTAILVACGAGSLWFAVESARDVIAFQTIASADHVDDFYRAVRVAPQNYEARMMLALRLVRANKCDLAEPHIMHASRLQPFSGATVRLRAICDKLTQSR